MAKVVFTNVTKTHGDSSPAQGGDVQNINLEIPDRALVALAGPPGSGGTTLLRLVAGLEEATGGDISIGDKRANNLPLKKREVGMVFAQPSLYPQLSVHDGIALGLKMRKFSHTEIEKRVKDAAQALGLQDLLAKKAAGLSAAQQQRAALARAIARQPMVLLLDDPFSGLEPKGRAELRETLSKLHGRLQTTILLATNDPLEAMTLADHVAVLEKGVLRQFDKTQAAYEKPQNVFVAGFLGKLPMNLVRGELRRERSGLLFREADEGTIELRWSNEAQPKGLESFVGRQIIAGIRPEEIEPLHASAVAAGPGSFPAIIDLVEPTGDETILHLQTGAHRLLCRGRGFLERSEAGHRARFSLDSDRLHFFDPTSGQGVG
jgi:multiple sugar transport system ATP-binding protein